MDLFQFLSTFLSKSCEKEIKHKLRRQKANSTLRASRAVPHPSTDRTFRRLTSEFGWDRVYSKKYGRWRKPTATHRRPHEMPHQKMFSQPRIYKNANSTLRASRAIPHPSTDRAFRRLTSEFGWDRVYSTKYGRWRKPTATHRRHPDTTQCELKICNAFAMRHRLGVFCSDD